MNGSRLVWVLMLPFLLCVVVPSIVGALLLDADPLSNNVILPIVGGFIVIVFPISIITAFYLTKPRKTEHVTNGNPDL